VAESMTSTEYELLTRQLMRLITERAPMVSARLEHDVKLEGRATSHQIDVLWEFLAADGSPRRVVIECRRFRKSLLKQSHVFAWSGVVRDLNTPELPTTGVMVTLSGYQSGARKVADTYGVVILQLREPTPADLEARLAKIVVQAVVRMPHIGSDVHVDAVEMLGGQPDGLVDAEDFGLLRKGGGTVLLQDYLWAGVLGGFDEPPAPLRRITRDFSPPVVLTLRGRPLARITSVSATVGEIELAADRVVLGGGALAWMIANVLDGTRVWFTDTDGAHVSDDQGVGVALATDVILGHPAVDPVP
jgi:hypothetical protein